MSKRTEKLIAAIFLLSAANAANADEWTGNDKTLHFALGAAISAAAGVHYRDPMKGFMLGAGVGLAKEALDATAGGKASGKDFVVTALGAAIGAAGSHIIISPNFIGYRAEF